LQVLDFEQGHSGLGDDEQGMTKARGGRPFGMGHLRFVIHARLGFERVSYAIVPALESGNARRGRKRPNARIHHLQVRSHPDERVFGKLTYIKPRLWSKEQRGIRELRKGAMLKGAES
jgi:hypothetical protein